MSDRVVNSLFFWTVVRKGPLRLPTFVPTDPVIFVARVQAFLHELLPAVPAPVRSPFRKHKCFVTTVAIISGGTSRCLPNTTLMTQHRLRSLDLRECFSAESCASQCMQQDDRSILVARRDNLCK